ncbi:hypothetical protein AB0F17_26065 [Nonomuraea sp. NPDC026600]|uniref:hypothetical protein n=1 Tax=Nonomuraea sp. NPDC026600 TaxID=3155363 RepID=UPI0033DC7CAC
MTARSRFAQRSREARAALLGRLAGRVFTRKTSGIDGFAKRLIAKQVPPAEHDPELDHPDHERPTP